MRIAFHVLLLSLLLVSAVATACPFDTTRSSGSRQFAELEQVDPGTLDSDCYCKLVSLLASQRRKTGVETILQLAHIRSGTHPLSSAELLCLARYDHIRDNPALWRAFIALWERGSATATYEVLANLINAGQVPMADSLYEALDIDSVLTIHDLMRWAQAKTVLGQLLQSARIFCRVSAREPRLTPIVFSQLAGMLDDSPPDTIARVLGEFAGGYLKTPRADTVLLRDWLTQIYGRFGMHDHEIKALISLETASAPVIRQLIEIARERFIRKEYRQVASPARLAFERLPRGDLRSLAATLLYQSYLERGNNDSALIWLGKSEFSNEMRTIDAVVLYQHAGQLRKSASLIDSLSPSAAKDTLMVRQLLYTEEPLKAAGLASELVPVQGRSVHELTLWKVRTFLYSGKTTELAALLDSVLFPVSLPQSGEVLLCRYWLQLLRESQAALDLWSAIEYDLYVGKHDRAARRFALKKVPAPLGRQLALRVAREYIGKGSAGKALELLDAFDSDAASPEFLYHKSDALLRVGDLEQAREILQHLLLEYPHDIFSSKARVLLSQMLPRS